MKYFAEAIGYICIALVIISLLRSCRDVLVDNEATMRMQLQQMKK